MKRKNNFVKGLLLSLISLTVGFFAISLPFNLFNQLSDTAMEVIFISELIIYFAIGMIFLVIKDKKEQERIKNEIRHSERQKKINLVKENWIDIAA